MAFPAQTEDDNIVQITQKEMIDGKEVFTDEQGNTYENSLLHPLKIKLLNEVKDIIEAVADKAIEEIKDVREAVTELIEEQIGPDPEVAELDGTLSDGLEEEPTDPEAA